MTLNRYAKRRDGTEKPLIKELTQCGYQVRQQDFPDLAVRRLVWPDGVVQFLEVDGVTRNRKRGKKQLDFLSTWRIPIVKTLDQALAVLRLKDRTLVTSVSCVSKPPGVPTNSVDAN